MERTDIDRGLTADIVDQVRQAEEILTRDEFGNLVREYSPKATEATLREEGTYLGAILVVLAALATIVYFAGLN